MHADFSHPADAFFLSKGLAFVRQLVATPALAAIVGSELSPGAKVPAIATDAEWEAWTAQHVVTEYHPIGSTSLLHRWAGGVVNERLVVYGTKVGTRTASSYRCWMLTLIFPLPSIPHFFYHILRTASQNLRVIDAGIMPLHLATHVSRSRSRADIQASQPADPLSLLLFLDSNCRL